MIPSVSSGQIATVAKAAGSDVLTRFPADDLLVAGRHYFLWRPSGRTGSSIA